jgi:hypothetical protein
MLLGESRREILQVVFLNLALAVTGLANLVLVAAYERCLITPNEV